MKRLLLFFAVILLVGCSPQKRISRIAEKYNLKQFETVMFKDTVYIESKIYTFQTQIDSSGYFNQNIKGNEMSGLIKDSILYVKFTTNPDTVYIDKPIDIQTIKIEKVAQKNNWIPICVLILFGCVSGYFCRKLINEKKQV